MCVCVCVYVFVGGDLRPVFVVMNETVTHTRTHTPCVRVRVCVCVCCTSVAGGSTTSNICVLNSWCCSTSAFSRCRLYTHTHTYTYTQTDTHTHTHTYAHIQMDDVSKVVGSRPLEGPTFPLKSKSLKPFSCPRPTSEITKHYTQRHALEKGFDNRN